MLLFILHRLWSIIDDSGSVVSSIVSSHPALLSFHMLAGNLDRAPEVLIHSVFEENSSLQIDFSSFVSFGKVRRNFLPHVYTFM